METLRPELRERMAACLSRKQLVAMCQIMDLNHAGSHFELQERILRRVMNAKHPERSLCRHIEAVLTTSDLRRDLLIRGIPNSGNKDALFDRFIREVFYFETATALWAHYDKAFIDDPLSSGVGPFCLLPRRPGESHAHGVTKDQLHDFIAHGLERLIEQDHRIHRNMTEYTLQSVIFEYLSFYVGRSWTIRVEDFIPGMNRKADLVLYKLTRLGEFDRTHGAIAIEVKPNGNITSLKKDIAKLKKYICSAHSTVNFTCLIYLSSSAQQDQNIDGLARHRGTHTKIRAFRINPNAYREGEAISAGP